MVMHARKQPRLDDGYMEKRDSHPFQSSQYPSKNYGIDNYGDRYKREGGSSDRCRDNSPSRRLSPRYHNKGSYSEKIKERYDKGSSSFPDRKANHTYTGQRSNNQNGNYDKTVKNCRDVKEKETKPEPPKPPARTCGDWSEHVSSSGMHYYYNCKTEVSQWEKPKDWADGPGSKLDAKVNHYSRGVGTSSAGGSAAGSAAGTAKASYPVSKPSVDKSKHSIPPVDRTLSEKNLKRSLSDINYPHSGKPDKKYIIEKFQASQHLALEQQHPRGSSQYRPPCHPLDHAKFEAVLQRKDNAYTDSAQANRRFRRNSEGNRSHAGGGGHVTPRKHNHDSQMDDMDISPGSSPSSSRRSSCAGTPQLGPSSSVSMSLPASTAAALAGIAPTGTSSPLISRIPLLISELSGSQRNEQLTHDALQTLQRLQEVISRQLAQQTSPGNPAQQSAVPTSDMPSQAVQTHIKPHQHHPHPSPHPVHHNSNLLLSPHHPHHPHPAHTQPHPAHTQPHPSHSQPHPQLQPHPHLDNNQHHQHPHPAGHRDPPHTSGVYGLRDPPHTPGMHGQRDPPHTPGIHGLRDPPHTPGAHGQRDPPHTPGAHGQREPPHTPGAHGLRDPPHTPGAHNSSSVYGKLNQVSSHHDDDPHLTGLPTGGESPLSETSQGPSCLSPGSSTTSSQTAAVAQVELSAAGMKQETTMGINPARKNYYNEALIGHVLGWQAEHAERQAKKYRQENVCIGSMRCSQVSVELKRARSLVRIAEIQSTLHEQRILFLAQQIHELENMKPPSFSSSHSFMSSSSLSHMQ